MATKKKTAKAEVQSSVNAEVKADSNELVMEAKIEAKVEESAKESAKENVAISSTVTLINTSYNEILLDTGIRGASVRIAPKEIKQVSRELVRKLLQNKMIRRWFDKGVITSNIDANETDLNEATAPESLKGPVERTDSVSTISAKVTKFKKDGNVKIEL